MVVTLDQQYNNIGEKPIVILYTYIINRHAGTPKKTAKTKYIIKHGSNNILLHNIDCEAEVATLKREQRGP